MKRRPRRKSEKPPPERPAPVTFLQYKVVELSTVDETVLERTLNHWVAQGWTFDGVQFAMRESSKRPAMAFVFFTRQAEAPAETSGSAEVVSLDAARPPVSAFQRLAQLAGEGEDDP